MARPSNRDRVLDAYEALLVDGAGATVTLDAVAEAAAVSKGGLLYHFPSKEALVDGLAGRLRERAAADVDRLRGAPEGPVAYWVRTANSEVETGLGRTYQALLGLAGTGQPAARAVIAEVERGWTAALEDLIPDPVVARVVRLVGDGLYLESLTGLPGAPDDAALVALLESLARR
ncbi:transcriptional regulator, TetR family [Klenkia marina]|uniref:Transcriptional regulator, TetR family n=1 Tax=Klenkia marina TaxID=1960309 RepID=A0A1G4Y3G5_9ACTN|nr:TetR/AcrR family transcriptional regulator [Klenkia marina]SCX47408.1 transcriptional regulator, TetR family [Klenkia marina]